MTHTEKWRMPLRAVETVNGLYWLISPQADRHLGQMTPTRSPYKASFLTSNS